MLDRSVLGDLFVACKLNISLLRFHVLLTGDSPDILGLWGGEGFEFLVLHGVDRPGIMWCGDQLGLLGLKGGGGQHVRPHGCYHDLSPAFVQLYDKRIVIPQSVCQ